MLDTSIQKNVFFQLICVCLSAFFQHNSLVLKHLNVWLILLPKSRNSKELHDYYWYYTTVYITKLYKWCCFVFQERFNLHVCPRLFLDSSSRRGWNEQGRSLISIFKGVSILWICYDILCSLSIKRCYSINKVIEKLWNLSVPNIMHCK